MKKILFLLAFLPLLLVSCSKDDDELSKEPVISAITKTELESVPSFTYRDYDDDVLYIKFRNGKIYTKEVTKSGMVCNEDVMDYTMTGEKIDITFVIYGNPVKFDGTIQKIIKEGETKKLKLDLDRSVQTARWLSNTYEWSTTNFQHIIPKYPKMEKVQYSKKLPHIIAEQLKEAGDYGMFIKSIVNYTTALNYSYSQLRETDFYLGVLHHLRMLTDVIFKVYALYLTDSKETFLKRFIEDKRIDNQTYKGVQLTNGLIKQKVAEKYEGIDTLYDESNKYIHPSIFYYNYNNLDDAIWYFAKSGNKYSQSLSTVFYFDTLNNILVDILMDLWNEVVVPKCNLKPITKRAFNYPLGFTPECHLAYIEWKQNSKSVISAKKKGIAPY